MFVNFNNSFGEYVLPDNLPRDFVSKVLNELELRKKILGDKLTKDNLAGVRIALDVDQREPFRPINALMVLIKVEDDTKYIIPVMVKTSNLKLIIHLVASNVNKELSSEKNRYLLGKDITGELSLYLAKEAYLRYLNKFNVAIKEKPLTTFFFDSEEPILSDGVEFVQEISFKIADHDIVIERTGKTTKENLHAFISVDDYVEKCSKDPTNTIGFLVDKLTKDVIDNLSTYFSQEIKFTVSECPDTMTFVSLEDLKRGYRYKVEHSLSSEIAKLKLKPKSMGVHYVTDVGNVITGFHFEVDYKETEHPKDIVTVFDKDGYLEHINDTKIETLTNKLKSEQESDKESKDSLLEKILYRLEQIEERIKRG